MARNARPVASRIPGTTPPNRCCQRLVLTAWRRPGEGMPRRQPMVGIRNLRASVARDEDGQGLAEYALILALIAIISIVALVFLGSEISKILWGVGQSL